MTQQREFLQDLLIGAVGGLIGTWALEKVSSALYSIEDPAAREREERLRKAGDPSSILAKRLSDEVLRLTLTDAQKQRLAMSIHYGFGAVAGSMFGALVARAPYLTAGWGALFGTLVWLLADETGMPLMALSRPSQDYPWQTHARAFTAHLAYGAAAVGTYTTLKKLAS